MTEVDIKIAYEIERLLNYALEKELILKEDVIITRNTFMSHFKINEPYCGEGVPKSPSLAAEILEKLLDLSFEKGLITDNTVTVRSLESAKIMGYITPRQSEVIKKFNKLYKSSPEKATGYFYALSKSTDYIQTTRTDKNICWTGDTHVGKLEITINLSKPEKDPKEIAAAKNAPQLFYPKCLLCVENAGYEGRANHPARQNHRLIPITLGGDTWYFQYSPYLYYNEHSIILNENHVPMKIDRGTFLRLLEFLDKFPHYFIGSNADLPIVGGSILSHDHFQGGRHSFPMEKAPVVKAFVHNRFKDVEICVVKWPLSTIRLKSPNKEALIDIGEFILNQWKVYWDKTADIHAFTENNGVKTPHNTLTPIARRQGDAFLLDLVLRNNRTTNEFPLGIFHPHQDVHHIKKENIGLIEVMGLAILPPRLKEEWGEIANILTGRIPYIKGEQESLNKHGPWIEFLLEKYGNINNKEHADAIIKMEIGEKFARVLEDAGVYKQNEYEKFYNFIYSMGFSDFDE